jgi:hypothetical protein
MTHSRLEIESENYGDKQPPIGFHAYGKLGRDSTPV